MRGGRANIADALAAQTRGIADGRTGRHQQSHEWRKGDLVLWDNHCTMHRRDAFDQAERRVMHRTQIEGTGRPA
jgi:alpha-ketoglutarate-dependent taurine dioxygenase